MPHTLQCLSTFCLWLLRLSQAYNSQQVSLEQQYRLTARYQPCQSLSPYRICPIGPVKHANHVLRFLDFPRRFSSFIVQHLSIIALENCLSPKSTVFVIRDPIYLALSTSCGIMGSNGGICLQCNCAKFLSLNLVSDQTRVIAVHEVARRDPIPLCTRGCITLKSPIISLSTAL